VGHDPPLHVPHDHGTRHTKTTLATIVGSYKSAVSKHIHRLGSAEFAWQRNYFENIIRNDNPYQFIANYIMLNPTTWENDRYNHKTIASTSK
jgi:hypothetical protein